MVGYDEDDKKACREAESKMPTTVKATLVKAASEAGMTVASVLAANMDPCELATCTLNAADKKTCRDARQSSQWDNRSE